MAPSPSSHRSSVPAAPVPAAPVPGADAMFDPPRDRLGARLHGEVFGALPSSTSRALDVPEVAAAVRPLLAAGWRPAQLAARVGALPAPAEPVPAVVAFLEALRERASPQRQWDIERAERARAHEQRSDREHAAASDDSRARWAAEARRALGLPARRQAAPVAPQRASCASCGGAGEFFVTRRVRLCSGCVDLLGTGEVALARRTEAS